MSESKGKAASVGFDKVTKNYGAVTAVDAISFAVQPGELVTLLGPSGCGKTTTLRLIAGLEMATSGRINIGGVDVTTLPATARDVSMVFQSYALFPHMNVAENVGYGLRVSGIRKPEVRERSRAVLELVGLTDFGNRMPSELSGGQQQRVAVARALVLEPQVLLFDEPLSNLDAKLRRRVREEIRDIQQKLGLTAVYVTHDQEEALAVSDRIIVMRNAKIAQEGTPRDLYERPVDTFVADFIGDANIVPGEIVAVDGGGAAIRVGAVDLPLPSWSGALGPARIAIRPEAIQPHQAGDGQAPTEGQLTGTISKASYLGSHVEYAVDTEVGSLFVVDPRIDRAIAVGEPVTLALIPRGVIPVGD
jgi:iron(III) transport system ATP-binding protein